MLSKRSKNRIALSLFAVVIAYFTYENVRIFLVISGSMSPAISPPSLVISRRVSDPSKINVGTIITYKDANNRRTTAHRVVEFHDRSYLTQGDANNYIDRSEAVLDEIVGRVILILPINDVPNLYLQTMFLLLNLLLGVLIRNFLLFLFRYGSPCSSTTYNSVH